MNRATSRYWAAYEKAVDMKIESVMKKTTPFKATNEDSFRRMVHRRCRKAFQYIDEHGDSFKVIAIMIEKADIDGFPTNEVYDLYCHYCNSLNFKVIKKEYFTKFVCDYFDYIVVDKRLNRLEGNKCRIFIKKAGE